MGRKILNLPPIFPTTSSSTTTKSSNLCRQIIIMTSQLFLMTQTILAPKTRQTSPNKKINMSSRTIRTMLRIGHPKMNPIWFIQECRPSSGQDRYKIKTSRSRWLFNNNSNPRPRISFVRKTSKPVKIDLEILQVSTIGKKRV